jgi:ethanolamine utilization protein EutN
MRIARIIGTVTLSQSHPTLRGAPLKLAVPLTLDELLQTQDTPSGEDLVVLDEFGAGVGDRIMLSEGAEAAQPYYPEMKPIDAYNAGILDSLDVVPLNRNA